MLQGCRCLESDGFATVVLGRETESEETVDGDGTKTTDDQS